jgi:hypothetical protein
LETLLFVVEFLKFNKQGEIENFEQNKQKRNNPKFPASAAEADACSGVHCPKLYTWATLPAASAHLPCSPAHSAVAG